MPPAIGIPFFIEILISHSIFVYLANNFVAWQARFLSSTGKPAAPSPEKVKLIPLAFAADSIVISS